MKTWGQEPKNRNDKSVDAACWGNLQVPHDVIYQHSI